MNQLPPIKLNQCALLKLNRQVTTPMKSHAANFRVFFLIRDCQVIRIQRAMIVRYSGDCEIVFIFRFAWAVICIMIFILRCIEFPPPRWRFRTDAVTILFIFISFYSTRYCFNIILKRWANALCTLRSSIAQVVKYRQFLRNVHLQNSFNKSCFCQRHSTGNWAFPLLSKRWNYLLL